MQRRRGRRLFEEARSPEGPKPGGSFVLTVACWAILCTTPLLVIAGVGVLAVAGWNPLAWGLGGLLLLIAWVLRPQAPRLRGVPADPARHPVLFEIVGEVGRRLGTRPPTHIVLNDELNASVDTVGWRRTRVLTLGLPLLAVLDAPGRIAIIGHEMAHFAADDPARSRVFSWTWNTLQGWAELTNPEFRGDAIEAFSQMLAYVFMRLVSMVPRAMARVLTWAVFDDHVRAEYRADRLGAEVAGTDGFVSAMRTLLVSAEVFDEAVQRVALGTSGGPVVAQLASQIAQVPDEARAQLEEVDVQMGTQLDQTHPPTPWRIEVLLARPITASVVLDTPRARRLEDELAQHYPAVNRRLVDAYRWARS